MDLKSLLNQALNSDLVKQGSSNLGNIANKGNLTALGTGALGGGLVGLLMGSKKAQKLGKKALGIGGAAALGALAFKVYSDWQSDQAGSEKANVPDAIHFDENIHSVLILKAMIAAAKADGHVDNAEQEQIQQAISAIGADDAVNRLVSDELDKPLDPVYVAGLATTPEQAAEIYLASCLVIDEQNFMEKAYLKELASQLGLADDLVCKLESQLTQSVRV